MPLVARDRIVTAPDGRTWRIGRRWVSWKPTFPDFRWWHHRNRGRHRRGERDIDDSSGWIELLEWAQEIGLVILLALALLALMFFLLLPFVIFLVEALVFAIALVLAVVSRQIFRRPWTVEAVPDGDHGKAPRWHVVGLRRAQAAIDEAAAAIARGRAPTPNDAIPV